MMFAEWTRRTSAGVVVMMGMLAPMALLAAPPIAPSDLDATSDSVVVDTMELAYARMQALRI